MRNLTLIMIPLILASCGDAKKTSTNLEISSSFLTSNTTFPGGLIITGKNLTTNHKFSYSMSAGNNMNLQLDKGSWVISAVGWNGGGTYHEFAGIPYCGSVTRTLVNSDEFIQLDIRKENCGSTEFSSGHLDLVGAVSPLKKLGLISTCKSFFKKDLNPSVLVKNQYAVAHNDCNFQDQDLKTEVQSIKIRSLDKNILGVVTPGLTSTCISSPSSSSINLALGAQDVRLPFDTIPFLIETYKDPACVMPLASYAFSNGLSNGNPAEFDHMLRAVAGNGMNLWLPGGISKRAKSPLAAIMPKISCFNGAEINCNTAPSNTTYDDYHIIFGSNGQKITLQAASCSSAAPVFSGAIPPGLNVSATCTDIGSEVEITLSFSGGLSPGGHFRQTFVNLGVTYSVRFTENGEAPRYLAQRNIVELIGSSNPGFPPTFFQPYDDEEHRSTHGPLTEIRDKFTANGASSVFRVDENKSFIDNCLALNTTESISRFNTERNVIESFRVAIHNNITNAPTPYFCDASNTSPANCSAANQAFNKRMVIYEYSISPLPLVAIEFNCSSKFGKFGVNSPDIENGLIEYHKQIVSWNTQDIGLQRFEQIESTSGSSYVRKRMSRFQKVSAMEYEAKMMGYSNKTVSGVLKESANVIQFKTVSVATQFLYFAHDSEFEQIGTLGNVFPLITEGTDATDKIELNVNWPMPLVSGITPDPGITDFNLFSTDYIDTDLPMTSATMIEPDFDAKFSTSLDFFSAP